MSQSHRSRGGTTDEAFQEQCFPWESGALVVAGFDLFNFLDLLHDQKHFQHTRGKEYHFKEA